MLRMGKLTASIVGLLIGCGGTQSPANGAPVGDTHAEPTSEAIDVPAGLAGQDGTLPAEDEVDAAEADVVPEEPPLVTFRLLNQANEDLVFSIDKGWQPVIFAFSGEPPNAKSIVMFPKFCTVSCDTPAEERCPHCPEPENVREAKESEQRKVVAAGASIEVPWDGQIYVYEKIRGKRRGKKEPCECYRKEPVPPETYTVRACGLRITKTASSTTKYQCVDGTMTLPAEGPQVVTLEFPAP